MEEFRRKRIRGHDNKRARWEAWRDSNPGIDDMVSLRIHAITMYLEYQSESIQWGIDDHGNYFS